MNSSIVRAEVYLDDDMPEYMEGIIRIGSLEFYGIDDDLIEDVKLNNQLVDNTEYYSRNKLIEDTAKRLGLPSSAVEIIE